MRLIFALLLMTGFVSAQGERAGNFDYYVLSLSWSPNWCALEGDARKSPQCDTAQDFGWVLHGLWPQYEQGWPSYCTTSHRDPSRTQTRDMGDIMGSPGAAWYQWKKHGRCSGLSSSDYFATARRAYSAINRPPVFRKLTDTVTLPASVVEQAFLQSNPNLSPEMITITCKSRRIQEARLCLTRDLQPRKCGGDVAKKCVLSDAVFDPIR
ncbi:MAG: ribonuclease T2 family protein [Paracoccaceae bacterium]